MSAEVSTPGGTIKNGNSTYTYDPVKSSFEARITIGNIYVRPGHNLKWFSASLADLSDFDEDWNSIDFTQFVINPEFLGQETTKEGSPVYHVRIGIDAAKVTEEAEKHVKPKICDKAKEEIAKLATSTMTDDIWIGVNDKLVYQATEKFLNTDLMLAYDDMIEFYKWGERVDISPPPPQDVTTIDLSGSNDSQSCPA